MLECYLDYREEALEKLFPGFFTAVIAPDTVQPVLMLQASEQQAFDYRFRSPLFTVSPYCLNVIVAFILGAASIT